MYSRTITKIHGAFVVRSLRRKKPRVYRIALAKK